MNTDKLDRISLEVAREIDPNIKSGSDAIGVHEFARRLVARLQQEAEPAIFVVHSAGADIDPNTCSLVTADEADEYNVKCRTALYTFPPSQSAEVPAGMVLVPKEPNKAALIGEFSFTVQQTCSACSFHGAQDDCEVCGGEIEYEVQQIVPWTTVKEIYSAAIAAPARPVGGEGKE